VVALDSGSWVLAGLSCAFPDLQWQIICHADFGGVMVCCNWIGSSKEVHLLEIETVSYRHFIGEVLKSTLEGCFGKEKPAPTSFGTQERLCCLVVMEQRGLI
jgi:hypothetical protein